MKLDGVEGRRPWRGVLSLIDDTHAAANPPGEWSVLEVYSEEERLAAALNGKQARISHQLAAASPDASAPSAAFAGVAQFL